MHLYRQVYLDHAGTTLYSASQVAAQSELLLGAVYGNPHSGNPSSEASSMAVRPSPTLPSLRTSLIVLALRVTQAAIAALR